MYYYPTDGVLDYIYGLIGIVTVIIALVIIYRLEKRVNYLKHHDTEYLRTLELPELRFLRVSADDTADIDRVVEEKKG